jgi:hypothetical protein
VKTLWKRASGGRSLSPIKTEKMRVILLLPFLLLACAKNGPAPKMITESIAGTWLKTAEAANGQNLWCLYYYDTCSLDDAWRFEMNGRYTVVDTGMQCPGIIPAAGAWKIDGEKLWIDSTAYQVLRCDAELWLEGERVMSGFRVRHEQRFRRP